MNNYDYPLGADNEDAPWNQKDVKPEKFEIELCQELAKTDIVETDNYIPGETHIEWDHNEKCIVTDSPDTSETDWENEWSQDHETPATLIDELRRVKEEEIRNLLSSPENTASWKLALKNAQYWVRECDNWETVQTEAYETD